jgi:hypothetical protein
MLSWLLTHRRTLAPLGVIFCIIGTFSGPMWDLSALAALPMWGQLILAIFIGLLVVKFISRIDEVTIKYLGVK